LKWLIIGVLHSFKIRRKNNTRNVDDSFGFHHLQRDNKGFCYSVLTLSVDVSFSFPATTTRVLSVTGTADAGSGIRRT